MKRIYLTTGFVLSAALLAVNGASAQSTTIQKCQDADGNWHYGDYAAEVCAQSVIESMDRESGLKVGEQGLPPSKEEIEAEEAAKAQAEADEARQAKQRAKENRILAIYESEDQIINARDERVKAISNSIEFNNTMQERLEKRLAGFEGQVANQSLKETDREALESRIKAIKSQIAEYQSSTTTKEKEKSEMEMRYNGELEFYRFAKQQREQGS